MKIRNAQGIIKELESFGTGIKGDEINIGKRYDSDVLGSPKTIIDYKIFSDTFSSSINPRIWEEGTILGNPYDHLDHVHNISFVNAKSTKGTLELSSGIIANGGSQLMTMRSFEYQPNRGIKFSTNGVCVNPDFNGFREFGLISHDDGVFFRQSGNGTLGSSKLEVCVMNNLVFTLQQDITNLVPSGFDISKVHSYDVQLDLVGRFIFYVDKEPIHEISNINVSEYASLGSANLQAGYRCYSNDGSNIIFRSVYSAIFSEGGIPENNREYDDITTFLSGLGRYVKVSRNANNGTAVICVKMPRHVLYEGQLKHLSDDIVITQLTNFTADESGVSIFVGRDTKLTNISAILDNPDALLGFKNKDSTNIQYMIGGDGTALNTAFQLDKINMTEYGQSWSGLKDKNPTIQSGANSSPFILPTGSYLVVRVISDGTNKNCNASISYEV